MQQDLKQQRESVVVLMEQAQPEHLAGRCGRHDSEYAGLIFAAQKRVAHQSHDFGLFQK